MQNPHVFIRRLGMFCMIPIAVLLLSGAGYSAWNTKRWLTHTVEVRGQVIEMLRVRDSDNTDMYAPVVRFQTAEGRTVEFQSSLRTNPPAYRTGQSVPVVYDPE